MSDTDANGDRRSESVSRSRRTVVKTLGAGAVATATLSNTALAESDRSSTAATDPLIELDLPSDAHEVPGDGVPEITRDGSYSWEFDHTPGEGWHYGRKDSDRSGVGERIFLTTEGVQTGMRGDRLGQREFSQAYVAYFDFVAETDSILFDAMIDIDATIERNTIFGAARDTRKSSTDAEMSAEPSSGESTTVEPNYASYISIGLGTASLLTGLAGIKDNSNHVGFEIGYFMQNLSRDSNLTRDDSRGDFYGKTLTSDQKINIDKRFQRRQTVDNLIEGDTYRIGIAYGGSLSGIRRSKNEFDMYTDSRGLELVNFSVEGR